MKTLSYRLLFLLVKGLFLDFLYAIIGIRDLKEVYMADCYISSILYGNENYQMIKEVIENSKYKVGIEYFLKSTSDVDMALIRKMKKDFLEVNSTLHSPMISCESTSEKKTIEYDDLLSSWEKTISLCLELGSKQIVFHTNNCFIKEENRLEKQKNSEENCLLINKICQEKNISLLVETLALPVKGAPIFTDVEFVDFIIKNDLFALIDVGHMNLNNYNYEYVIKKLNHRIKAYHLHNNDGKSDTHQRINDGTFNYEKFYQLYKKYTPEAALVFEYIDIWDLTAAELKSDIENLYENIMKK